MAGNPESPKKPAKNKPLRVAVCIDTRDGPARQRLLGVYSYAMPRCWNLLLVRGDDANAVRQVAEMRVDGAILFDRSRRFHQQLRRLGVLCVETSARNLDCDDAAVFVDDDAIAEIAVRHLVQTGLEHFGYCGPSGTQVPAARRGARFCEGVKRLGFSVDTFDQISAMGETPRAPLTAWLRRLEKPAGVLAFDDKVAERVLTACRWAGISVPEQVAIVGVGNDELICELVEPQLTSVSVPVREIGRLAAETLDALAHGRSSPRQCAVVPSEMIVRASSERLPLAHPSVVAAINLIRASSNAPYGTDQIAVAIGISRRSLERRFATAMGQTVHDFIVDVRLRHAKRLLRRSDGSIGEVARQCGYSAPSAFSRMFEAREGCRPEAYRRKVSLAG